METSRDVRFSEAENYYPLENVSQGFEEEGQREIPEEVELNSGVTSLKIQESVGSGPQNSESARELQDEAATTNAEMGRGAEPTVRTETVPTALETVQRDAQPAMVLRRSTRETREPERLTASQVGELHHVYGYCSMAVGEEPATMKQAMESEHKEDWAAALKEEHNSIARAGTFELVDRPKGKKVLRSKYVLKIKRNQDGTVNKFKVRLVMLGNMQVEGEDYTETFAPVMKYQSLRTILALACEEGMHVHQMDVKTAFLNGDLNEEVYMEQPDHTMKEATHNKVWKLKS